MQKLHRHFAYFLGLVKKMTVWGCVVIFQTSPNRVTNIYLYCPLSLTDSPLKRRSIEPK